MNIKRLSIWIMLVAILTGCQDQKDNLLWSKQNAAFVDNGLYINDKDLVVMLVDSTRDTHNLVIGDFTYNAVYFTDTAKITDSSIKTTGLVFANHKGVTALPAQKLQARFVDDQAMLISHIKNQNLIYSMQKAADSLPLSAIVGIHSDSGSNRSYSINADGSFEMKGVCAIRGSLERKGAYFNVAQATANSCLHSAQNGHYHGVLLTVAYQGEDYLAGLFANKEGLIWDIMPLA